MSSLLGIAGIIYGLHFVFTSKNEGFTGFFDVPSMVLLGLLPPCILLLSHRLTDFFMGLKILVQAMFRTNTRMQTHVINSLTRCSAAVRSDGVGALVKEKKGMKYDLMVDGVSLIINNFTVEEIRHNLIAKIQARQSQMSLAGNLFENMAKVSPGVGMIGTLIGLINMMKDLGDTEKIGAGMALALITTLYGLLLGTLLYAPWSEKITLESEKISDLDKLVMEGVLALKSKKSSVHLKDIMKTYTGSQSNEKKKEGGKAAR